MQDTSLLMSLALTEAVLLESGQEIAAIASAIRQDGNAEQMVHTLAVILASTLEDASGSVGLAVERIDRWRYSVLVGSHRESEA
jgi:hypothetical protein